jgi:hypothetical protein
MLADNAKLESGTALNFSAQGCAMTVEKIPVLSTYLSLQVDLLNGSTLGAIELAGVR